MRIDRENDSTARNDELRRSERKALEKSTERKAFEQGSEQRSSERASVRFSRLLGALAPSQVLPSQPVPRPARVRSEPTLSLARSEPLRDAEAAGRLEERAHELQAELAPTASQPDEMVEEQSTAGASANPATDFLAGRASPDSPASPTCESVTGSAAEPEVPRCDLEGAIERIRSAVRLARSSRNQLRFELVLGGPGGSRTRLTIDLSGGNRVVLARVGKANTEERRQVSELVRRLRAVAVEVAERPNEGA